MKFISNEKIYMLLIYACGENVTKTKLKCTEKYLERKRPFDGCVYFVNLFKK